MKIELDIPKQGDDLRLIWEDDFKILTSLTKSTAVDQTHIVLSANSPGLISLARYLLYLAQPSASIGTHYHFDADNSLEKGSVELIIEKIE
jgi:hypothetical protein